MLGNVAGALRSWYKAPKNPHPRRPGKARQGRTKDCPGMLGSGVTADIHPAKGTESGEPLRAKGLAYAWNFAILRLT